MIIFPGRGRRPAARIAAVVAAAMLLGGGVAAATGSLPDPAQDAVSNAAGLVGLDVPEGAEDLPEEAQEGQQKAADNQAAAEDNRAAAEDMAANAAEFAQAVQDTIGEYTSALDTWTSCVADNAAARGETQSDPETRVEDDAFDPAEGCEDRPELTLPSPGDFGLGADDAGAPDDTGRPDDAGAPDDTGRPDDAGAPDDTGRPDDAGRPDGAGPGD